MLAVLGENELVRQAVGKPPIKGRGIRILSMGTPASMHSGVAFGAVVPVIAEVLHTTLHQHPARCMNSGSLGMKYVIHWNHTTPASALLDPALAAAVSADGGGMKGMATVRHLRELERHTGRRIHELFDLIGE